MAQSPADPKTTAWHRPQNAAPERAAQVTPSESTDTSGGISFGPRTLEVEGTDAGASSAIEFLRQSRLSAAAAFLCVAATAFVVFTLAGGDPLWPMHAAVAVCEAAAWAVLWRRAPLSARQARVLGIAIFGMAGASLAVMHYYWMLHFAEAQNALRLLGVVKNGFIIAMILMFAYAMLIPVAWRVAAGIVSATALIPVVVGSSLLLAHPHLARFAIDEGVFEETHMNVFLMLIATGLAVYGTHVLNTLRQEAFEARRLNQYQLCQRLGAGGMGEVYLAEHRLLKRLCALKLVRMECARHTDALARFEREVRAAARLSHPNIVEVYDYGYTQDGTFYYVMEYLRGFSLAGMVDRYGPLPPGRVIYLLQQACAALAEAHAEGLVHRDLKPANIFAAYIGRRHDVAKLLDFGLVKEVAGGDVALSAAGAVYGTPQYMAPEQAAGDGALDHRADLYALGGIAYYLLTGRPPFEGENAVAVIIAHARDPVPPLSRHCPEVAADLEQVVLRCLAKSPADRYQDAETLGQALALCGAAREWDEHQATRWWDEAGRKSAADLCG